MSLSNSNEVSPAILKAELSNLYKIGGVAAILQLVAILAFAIVMAALGPKPTSAAEYFAIHQSSSLAAFLRGDILLLVLIGLYLGTFPALYAALRHVSPTAIASNFWGIFKQIFSTNYPNVVTALGFANAKRLESRWFEN